jgi:hypothetical protein
MQKHWHQRHSAQSLLQSLTEQDLHIVRPFSYEPGLAYAAASDHGAKVIEQLTKLCSGAANRLFVKAQTEEARTAILNWYLQRVSVQGALASRFGDADRFRGHRVDDGSATRAFRAGFAGRVEQAA